MVLTSISSNIVLATWKKQSSENENDSLQVRELVPESQAYMDLLAFEQKLDATITRKKLDIQVNSFIFSPLLKFVFCIVFPSRKFIK